MICLTLMESTIEANLNILEKHRASVDMAELRLDMLSNPALQNPDKLKSDFNLPLIITFRMEQDGGRYKGEESYRRDVLLHWAGGGFDYLDLEMDVNFPEVEKASSDSGTRIIRSYHNSKGVPKNLESIIKSLCKKPGEIPKAAVFPGSSRETLELFRVIGKTIDLKEKIILGMGEYGLPSRILYKKFGSMLSFCSSPGKLGAPGHLSPEAMHSMYRAKEIDISTEIFGIIGNPVMHSRSPQLHNSAYIRADYNAVYLPFLVDDTDSFFELAELLGIKGFSVTVPHKVNVLRHLKKTSPEVEGIGSCNTVKRTGSCWKGFNTDLDGFLAPLKSGTNTRKLKSAAVIGAGGAARAVITALKSLGLDVVIFNRSEDKAGALASETGIKWFTLADKDQIKKYDLVVQTTTVGMSPGVNETPIPGYTFRKEQVAYDLVYTPEETRFLREAKDAGCIAIGGMAMLKAQGIRQFEIFTAREFPPEGHKGNF